MTVDRSLLSPASEVRDMSGSHAKNPETSVRAAYDNGSGNLVVDSFFTTLGL